jgi:hypothetical protein
MMATKETYEREGVPQKEWIGTAAAESRHYYTLNGVIKYLPEMYSVRGHIGWGPMDPELPASESANCKCDLLPAGFEHEEPKMNW